MASSLRPLGIEVDQQRGPARESPRPLRRAFGAGLLAGGLACAGLAVVALGVREKFAAVPFAPAARATAGQDSRRGGGVSALRAQLGSVAVDDKAEVVEYFNNEGFSRWSRIYSEDGEVNVVQMDIREGHAVTVDKVLGWVDSDGSAASGETFCDAGCGVGSLSLPLAQRGATVVASDISEAMVAEATKRAAAANLAERTSFVTSDLEALQGAYDTVLCIDVLIHYPPDKMAEMVGHLASLATKRLVISFAPDTWYFSLLKAFGGLFPGPSKTTRAYLHTEEAVVDALGKAGFKVAREEMTSSKFYFSRLLEAVRSPDAPATAAQ